MSNLAARFEFRPTCTCSSECYIFSIPTWLIKFPSCTKCTHSFECSFSQFAHRAISSWSLLQTARGIYIRPTVLQWEFMEQEMRFSNTLSSPIQTRCPVNNILLMRFPNFPITILLVYTTRLPYTIRISVSVLKSIPSVNSNSAYTFCFHPSYSIHSSTVFPSPFHLIYFVLIHPLIRILPSLSYFFPLVSIQSSTVFSTVHLYRPLSSCIFRFNSSANSYSALLILLRSSSSI
jgi:hypothetical protein